MWEIRRYGIEIKGSQEGSLLLFLPPVPDLPLYANIKKLLSFTELFKYCTVHTVQHTKLPIYFGQYSKKIDED